jgi:hypothetical protein
MHAARVPGSTHIDKMSALSQCPQADITALAAQVFPNAILQF